jgi:Asp23 family, cell envelope-related function/Family of unknown function (DUF6286)
MSQSATTDATKSPATGRAAVPGPRERLDTSEGQITVAENVVQKIAGKACREIVGVHAMGNGGTRAFGAVRERIPGSTGPNVAQGVGVEVGEKEAAVDLEIVVEYGVAGVLIVIGLVLMGLEVKRRRATRLPLEAADQATDAAVTRRGLARMLRAEATRVDGITGATARVSRGRARVKAASGARGKAAGSALTDEVSAYHGVDSAKGRVIGDGRDPRSSSHRHHGPGGRPAGPASSHRRRGLRPRPASRRQPVPAHPA